MEIDRVIVRLGADASQFFGVFDEVESRLVAFGSYAVLHAMTGIAKLGAEWEAMTTSFQTMIGSMEKGSKVLNEIRDLAIRTPFTTQGLARAGEMLLGFGVDGDSIVRVLERLGDIAGGNESKLMRLALAFGQVSTAGRFMGTELRQFTEAGVGAADFAKAYGTTEAKFLRDVRQGKVGVDAMVRGINELTDPGGRFAGRSDALFKKVVGRWNAFLESIQKSSAELGVKFFERFNVADNLKNLTDFADQSGAKADAIIKWAERALPIIQEIYDFGKANFLAEKDFISSLIGFDSIPTLEQVRDLLRELFDQGVLFSEQLIVGGSEIGDALRRNLVDPIVMVLDYLAEKLPAIMDQLEGLKNIVVKVSGMLDGIVIGTPGHEIFTEENGVENWLNRSWLGRRITDLNLHAPHERKWFRDNPQKALKATAHAIPGGTAFMADPNNPTPLKDFRESWGGIILEGLGLDLSRLSKDNFAEIADADAAAINQKEEGKKRWGFLDRMIDFVKASGEMSGADVWRQHFDNLKKKVAEERKKTDFNRTWNYSIKPFFDIFLQMQGMEPIGRKIPKITAPLKLATDIEKWATGIEKGYSKRSPLLNFTNDIENIRKASEGIGPQAAAALQMMTGANFLQTPLAFNPALNPKQADWALFNSFQSLKKAVDVDISSKMPQAIRKGTVEAQEIINRSQKPELTVQEEMRRVLQEAKLIWEQQQEYQRMMVEELKLHKDELDKIRRNLTGEEI